MTRNCKTERCRGGGNRKIGQLQNICCKRNYTKNTSRMETHSYLSKRQKELKEEIQRFKEKMRHKMKSELAELRKEMEEKNKSVNCIRGESHIRSKGMMVVLAAVSVQLGKL